jgi:hypothetical protein
MSEQQLASLAQSSSSPLHGRPPHVPPLHAIEQQSKARLHALPSATQ